MVEQQKAAEQLRRLFGLHSCGCGLQRLHGSQCGNGMLVDHLLLAVTDQYHHKAVVAGDDSPELEAVHKEQGHRNLLPAAFLQNGIL